MIKYEQALKKILLNTKKLPIEKAYIENALGRVLQEDICSKINMPPFNKSAMDGYALNKAFIKKLPIKLKCIGLIEAGSSFKKNIARGECVKIMTGAALPKGVNSVVKIEDVKQVGNYVYLTKTIKPEQNVCIKAEDIKKHEKILTKNTLILPQHISLLASAGVDFIKVVKEPAVCVLNTGGEIIPAGSKLTNNKIYNSNGPQFLALLKQDGFNPQPLGIAKDRPAQLSKAIKKGLKADVFLISGGVSVGDYDLVPKILKENNVKKVFHNVKCKPGKPLFFGKRKDTLVFGVPGNPVSNFLAYYIFIRPALFKMITKTPYAPNFKQGILKNTFSHKVGRKHFIPVKITQDNKISPINSNGSADILSLSKADGFMVADADRRVIKTKSKVEFITWKTE